jgi:hypothetical protein
MTPQERAGFAAAITEAITVACSAVREQFARDMAAFEQKFREQVQRCEHLEAQDAQLQRDLKAAREQLAEPPIVAAVMDAEGVLHLVQRNGERLTVPLADFAPLVAAAVDAWAGQAEQRLGARLDGEVARGMQRLGDAPRWNRTDGYAEGAVVTCYAGRTYVLRAGIRASVGQEPGECPDVWERIGSHGLRVMKAKPAAPEPGDIFTEGESRFIHDGESTTLLVPRSLKQSDLERAVKPLQVETRALAEVAGGVRRDVDGMRPVLERAAQAANDARNWIATEGHAVVARSERTEVWCENRRLLIDSPALARLVDAVADPDEGTP